MLILLITPYKKHTESNLFPLFSQLWYQRRTPGSTKCLKNNTIMHFKRAVILCALYFVTMTQSIGLTRSIIEKIVVEFERFENSVDQISPNEIEKIINDMGVQDLSGFTYEADTKDGRKVQQLLVLLAKTDMPSDHWLKRRFATHEVTIYLNLFRYHDENGGVEDGLLDFKELKNVIQALSLNEDEKESLAKTFKGDLTINFAEFLLAFVDIKPEGNGLTEKHIKELVLIKDTNVVVPYINNTYVTEFIKKLSIVDVQDMNWTFERFQNYALECQELVVFAAEYNKTAEVEHELVIPTSEVRVKLSDFAFHDKNFDGLLNGIELDEFVRNHFKGDTVGALLKCGDINDDNSFDIVELFVVIFKKRER
ncbi:uncharacterized protein LOC126835897 isoform X3 [Adelges cooleyi]|uniref:uncharacterized protein LOC126835897 isoform X2 n=1 Tax=Adelges cooleyi TaxID=133065 RepID=UPI00217FA81F|nr:uncharacterized protein LOC126835897 isoform X2 [Adelges cooleyi]XP_050424719.1 uncharacterized protein LOC126835897 isoform X3 [Adelges cooleyi]